MDHYEVLGISPAATAEEVKRAWRRAQVQWHPDRCAEAQASARFSAAAQAWEILRDPEARARYDLQRVASPAMDAAQLLARRLGRDLSKNERVGVRWLVAALRFSKR